MKELYLADCNRCPYVYICREEKSDYCFKDEADIKSTNDIANLEKEYKKYEELCNRENIDEIRMNSINARMGQIRMKIFKK